jgi:hypothetical protein
VFRCSKLAEWTLTPGKLTWPWTAFEPGRTAFAYPTSPGTLALRASSSLDRETRFDLPAALSVPTVDPRDEGTTSRQAGLHAFAVHPEANAIVAFGWQGELPAACVARAGAAPELVDLGPALGDMGPMAATFSRDGRSIWLSAESATGAAIVRLRFRDFALEAKVAFAPAPPPAAHELTLHPVEDAVLLTMACGQDGTFVRVARVVGGKLELAPGEGDDGLEPCGVGEATEDGRLVCLVGGTFLELRRWPDMQRVSKLELAEGIAANYNGVRVGGRFIVSASAEEDDGGDEDRALVFGDALDRRDDAPAPPGMWAGRLGPDRLVTIGREKSASRSLFVYAIVP